jgi:hypothetical protein
MDYFYDAQVRRYLTQFIRVMSNFAYKDAKGQLVKVPVRYGDMNRQVAHILRKNSENAIPSAPFIACYIKDLQFDRMRMQDPTFVSKVHIRERAYDETGNEYLNIQGANYTVERIMPTPYTITFVADIWVSNLDQKLQLWEQIVPLFTPSLEIQTTDNYIDWTSLSLLELDSQTFSSRSIPQGVEQDIDIASITFKSPIWITPPAKVKKLGIITKIIANIHALSQGEIEANYDGVDGMDLFGEPDARVVVTPGNFDILVLNNVATLLKSSNQGNTDELLSQQNISNWRSLLDLYPGQFKAGLSQLRLKKSDGNEIVAFVSLDPLNETKLLLNFDTDTIPANTIIGDRGTVDAIINPETFNPENVATGTRYLILEDINVNSEYGTPGYSGPAAWKNADESDFQAHANDIIEWDGSEWSIVFDASSATATIYITNSYTGIQYKWSADHWSKSFEGIYDKELWRLVL